MTDWVRLWHDMPTDPKWRVIAKRSGQPLCAVLAAFTMMLTNASANAAERGTLSGWDHEDVAAALDMEPGDIASIFEAMQGKVLDGYRLSGWERRQPKREDDSAARVAAFREAKRLEEQAKRDVTQRNAPETETETEKKELERERASAPATAVSPKAARGTRLSVDWRPSDDDMAFAESAGFSAAQAEAEFSKFRDYWIAKAGAGGVKADWSATARNWLRRAAETRSTGPPRVQTLKFSMPAAKAG